MKTRWMVLLIAALFAAGFMGCNKEQKKTLDKIRSDTNKALKKTGKAAGDGVNKVRDSVNKE